MSTSEPVVRKMDEKPSIEPVPMISGLAVAPGVPGFPLMVEVGLAVAEVSVTVTTTGRRQASQWFVDTNRLDEGRGIEVVGEGDGHGLTRRSHRAGVDHLVDLHRINGKVRVEAHVGFDKVEYDSVH